MQTQKKDSLLKRRSKILCIGAIAILCAIFALSWNITILKTDKNGNTYSAFESGDFSTGSPADVYAVSDNAYVHIGGKPIGISVGAGGIIVVDKCTVATKNGEIAPCKDLDIRKGDVICKINGESVESIYKLKKTMKASKDGRFLLTLKRGGDVRTFVVKAEKSKVDNEFKLGLMLKEDVSGVGTLTFVTKEGNFAALGHKIADFESNLSENLNQGNIYCAQITGVIKGERGKAGGLVADVNKLSNPVGEVSRNTEIGIYGKYDGEKLGDLYRIAMKGEAKVGKAQVLTTVDGSSPKFYDIDVVKVVSQSEVGEKGMVISVRDKELIDKTGGIVQGMSGSPIVQNGILIGAVTHVFVQDPTRGYAVHSRFMYDYATSLDKNTDVEMQTECAA